MMLVYVLQTLLPVALVLWMALLPPRNVAGFWLLSLAAALLILMAALQGVSVFPPWWVPYLLALSFVAAITLLLIRAPARPGPIRFDGRLLVRNDILDKALSPYLPSPET